MKYNFSDLKIKHREYKVMMMGFKHQIGQLDISSNTNIFLLNMEILKLMPYCFIEVFP